MNKMLSCSPTRWLCLNYKLALCFWMCCLFHFFPQISLLWHQLLHHCQDSNAVFLMPFIFVPDMFGTWGTGKAAGATAPLLPSNSIFLYGHEPCCKPTSWLGGKGCSSLPIMRWTASHWWSSIHVGNPSHNSKPYKAGKLRDLCFFPAIFRVWFGAFLRQNSFVFKHGFDCSHPVFYAFIIMLLWLLQITIISHPNSHSLAVGEVGCWKLKASCFAKVERSWEIF